MIIYLFGLPAAGKNYVAKIIEKRYKFYFYDADKDLTKQMLESIEQNKIFTSQMRNQYYDHIINKIKKLEKRYLNIVIAQATFRKIHRKKIKKNIPQIRFIEVRASNELRYQRLKMQKNIISLDYAKKIEVFYQKPEFEDIIFNEKNEADIIKQLDQFFS